VRWATNPEMAYALVAVAAVAVLAFGTPAPGPGPQAGGRSRPSAAWPLLQGATVINTRLVEFTGDV